MTGTDLCVNKPHKPRSYLNHLVIITNAGTSDIGTINSNDRIAETLYSLGKCLSQENMCKYSA